MATRDRNYAHDIALKSLEALIISLLSCLSPKDLKKLDCMSKQNLAAFLEAVGDADSGHKGFLAPELCADAPTLRHITLCGNSDAKDVQDALAVVDPADGDSANESVLVKAFKLNVNGVALIEFAKDNLEMRSKELVLSEARKNFEGKMEADMVCLRPGSEAASQIGELVAAFAKYEEVMKNSDMKKSAINSTVQKNTEDMHGKIFSGLQMGCGKTVIECVKKIKDIKNAEEGGDEFGPVIDAALDTNYEEAMQDVPKAVVTRLKSTLDELQAVLGLVHWASQLKVGVTPPNHGESIWEDIAKLTGMVLKRRLHWLNNAMNPKDPTEAAIMETLQDEVLKPFAEMKAKQMDAGLEAVGQIFKSFLALGDRTSTAPLASAVHSVSERDTVMIKSFIKLVDNHQQLKESLAATEKSGRALKSKFKGDQEAKITELQQNISAMEGYLKQPLHQEIMKRMKLEAADVAIIQADVEEAKAAARAALTTIIDNYVDAVLRLQAACNTFVDKLPDIEKKEHAFLKHIKNPESTMAKCAQLRGDLEEAVNKVGAKMENMQFEGTGWDEPISNAMTTVNDMKSIIGMNAMLTLMRNPATLSAAGQGLRDSLVTILAMFNEEEL